MIPKPGIYIDVLFSDYEKWEAINNSVLWTLISQSPLHAKEQMDNPPEPTEPFRIGRAFHTLLLEPRKFNRQYTIMPLCDCRTKEGKTIYEAFKQNNDGKEILTQKDFDQLDVMGDAIKKQVIYRYIQQGEAEVCIVWEDKKTGLLCKARIDYVHRKHAILIDLKSTTDASKYEFSKAIYNYGYFQQAAWYSDGWKILTGDEPCFVFLPVEKTPPYAVACYEVPEIDINAGRQSYRKALNIYAECVKKNEWPGYQKSVEFLGMPSWALRNLGIGNYEVFE